jgi:hypothetical protein
MHNRPSGHNTMAPASDSREARLECGEVLTFAPCPFPLPCGDDRQFLFRQRLRGPFDKNISYCPDSRQLSGFWLESAEQSERLQRVLGDFSAQAISWLATLLPGYAARWQPDQATFRPEEEATRRLRPTARNDLLHLDAFPSRPTHGRRILRLFINIHPADPRVWVTSDTFDKLLDRYGPMAGLPGGGANDWLQSLGRGFLKLLQPREIPRLPYDQFMLRFHHFLKLHEPFQERGVKKVWRFPPSSAWLLFTDMVSHGELRGQYALEHSFFIAPETLAAPEIAPHALLQRKCISQRRSAA